MAVQCSIVSSEVVEGRTAYTISVEREGRQRALVRRHYTDFLALDKEETVQGLLPESRPTLPPKGRLGLRHRLDLGSFNEKRRKGLQQYLEQLLQTEAGASAAVDRFLAANAAPAPPALDTLEQFLRSAGDEEERTAGDARAPEEGTEDAPARDFRLLASTGTWLQQRQPQGGTSRAGPAAEAAVADAAPADAEAVSAVAVAEDAAPADAAEAASAALSDVSEPAASSAEGKSGGGRSRRRGRRGGRVRASRTWVQRQEA